MRFRPTDPISPSFSPTVPTVHQALMQIELELASVRIEQPEWTPHQQLAEARRRCSAAMIAAADAIEETGLTSRGRMSYI
jgi:hypothetical protein